MSFRIRETGEYLATTFALRDKFQIKAKVEINQEVLNNLGVDPVFEGPQASGGTVYQYSQFSGLEQIDGKWYTKYVLGPIFQGTTKEDGTIITAAQQEAEYKDRRDAEQAENVRKQRNEMLIKSDWTQIQDSPVDKSAWAIYRQALRDVPSQEDFPWNVQWPSNI